MNIELAPRSANPMTYDEAVLYCTFCNHDRHTDWRLPNMIEYENIGSIASWYLDDAARETNYIYHVIPMRDV